MSILSEAEKEVLIEKAKSYDYVRFSWPDLNGIARGKTVPARFAEEFIPGGLSEYTGTICLGPRSEIPFIQRLESIGYGNSNFVPATKLYDLPWAGNGKHRVGQVICEAFWPDGSPVDVAPRTVARKQVERLEAMGYRLYSGFEVEFFVMDAKTRKPVFDGCDFVMDTALSRHSSWLFDVEKNMKACGIDIAGIHTEYGPGQFEFCMMPKYGMDPLDDLFVLKHAMKEIIPEHGCLPTFMACPFRTTNYTSGLHFNHSLWDAKGKSVFYDSAKPLKMSDTMRYWLGGLLKHTNALLALSCTTPNCYRRLHSAWAPGSADWGIDNRKTSFRIKNESAGSCLVENRLPSPACNPYLLAAVTIAAGIDGIQNKIEPPPAGKSDDRPLLPPFRDCIRALQEDKEIAEALGGECIEWWLAMKTCELEKFGEQNIDSPSQAEIENEKAEYFEFI